MEPFEALSPGSTPFYVENVISSCDFCANFSNGPWHIISMCFDYVTLWCRCS